MGVNCPNMRKYGQTMTDRISDRHAGACSSSTSETPARASRRPTRRNAEQRHVVTSTDSTRYALCNLKEAQSLANALIRTSICSPLQQLSTRGQTSEHTTEVPQYDQVQLQDDPEAQRAARQRFFQQYERDARAMPRDTAATRTAEARREFLQQSALADPTLSESEARREFFRQYEVRVLLAVILRSESIGRS